MASKKDYAAVAREWDERVAAGTEAEGLVRMKAIVHRGAGVRANVGLRLSSAEHKAVTDAASRKGVTFSEFVRQAALAAAAGDLEVEAGQKVAAMQEAQQHIAAASDALKRASGA